MAFLPKGRKGTSSKELTASAIVTTAGKAGLLYAITLLNGSADSSIIVEDGGSGGTARWKLVLDDTTALDIRSESITFDPPIEFYTDIYATLAGTGAVAYVSYVEL